VVHDPALEAEAERMGRMAATGPAPVQARPATPGAGPPRPGQPVQPMAKPARGGAILPSMAPAAMTAPRPILPGGATAPEPGRPILPRGSAVQARRSPPAPILPKPRVLQKADGDSDDESDAPIISSRSRSTSTSSLVDDDESGFEIEGLFESVERAFDLQTVYLGLPPTARKYAKRTKRDLSAFDEIEDPDTSPINALSLPRAHGGELSLEAIKIMEANQLAEAMSYLETAEKSSIKGIPGGLSKKEMKALRKRIAKALKEATKSGSVVFANELTKKSAFPELRNLTEGDPGAEAHSYGTVRHAGVMIRVYRAKKDLNYRPRLKPLESAITKIKRAGFDFPPNITAHFPKLARTLDLTHLFDAPKNRYIDASNGAPRAVFNPPNYIFISPEILGNPIAQSTGDEYDYLSTQLDPSGVATLVHECGHMMHYRTAPERYFGLMFTTWTEGNGNLARAVSAYAAGNPREFVAEVFLGIVYGRSFDRETLEMYRDLGGALPRGHAMATLSGRPTPSKSAKRYTSPREKVRVEKGKSGSGKERKLVGNCLYDAVRDAMQALGEVPPSVNQLRNSVANLILNGTVDVPQGIDANRIIQDLTTNQSWDNLAGDMAPELLAVALQRPIQIRFNNGQVRNLLPRAAAHPQLTVRYNGRSHYWYE
jgi:hypothetical protein